MTRLLAILAATAALLGATGASLAAEFGETQWRGVVVAYNTAIWTVAPPSPAKGLVLTCIATPCAGRTFVAVKPGQAAMGPINPSSVPIYRANRGNPSFE